MSEFNDYVQGLKDVLVKCKNGEATIGEVESFYLSIPVDDREYVIDECDGWEIRRCSVCGRWMHEGYILGDEYACSDECRRKLYSDVEYYSATVGIITAEQLYKALEEDGFTVNGHKLSLEEVKMYYDNGKSKRRTRLYSITADAICKWCEGRDMGDYDYAYYTEWEYGLGLEDILCRMLNRLERKTI